MNTTEAIALATAILAALGGGGLIGLWRLLKPTLDRNDAVVDAILGTAAIQDKSGAEIAPAQPGLVHRVTKVEEAVVEFRHVLGLLTEMAKRQDLLEHRVKALEDDKTEKLIAKAESAQMWRAIAEAKPETGAEAIPGATDPEQPEEQP